MKQHMKTLCLGLAAFVFFATSTASFAQSKTSSSAHEIKNEDLKEYVGVYEPDADVDGFSITIALSGEDRLMAQPTDGSQPNTLMVATEKDYFDLSGTPLVINFNRDDSGVIESLTFTQGTRSFTAERQDDN